MNTRNALNGTAIALIIIGLLLKARYLAGGPIAIILAAVIMLVTLFVFARKDNQEAGVPDGLNRFLVGTLALLIIGALFKMQHWPGANVLAVAAYASAFLLPVSLLVQKSDLKLSKQYVVTLFTFLVLLLGVLPRNPIARYIGRGWDFPLTGQEHLDRASSQHQSEAARE